MSEKLHLEGLKVIDAGSFIAGPVSTTILSDFGAEVIKLFPLQCLLMRPFNSIIQDFVRNDSLRH